MEKVFQKHRAPMLLVRPEDGVLLDANDAALRFYGYSREAMLKLHISDINMLSVDEIRQEMVYATREQRNYFLFRHRLASGEVRDVEVHSSPIDTGDEVQLLSIVYDITERRRTEMALARSEAFSQVMLSSIPLPVFYKDAEGRYLDCNTAFLQWTGLQREELLGKSVFELWHPELARLYDERDRALLEGEAKVQEYEGQLVGSDGRRRDVLFHKACVCDADDQRIGLVGVLLDITERKQAAEQARRLALQDELTQLPNRRQIRQRLHQALEKSNETGLFSALLFLDLDNFKPLNDGYGHEAGDRLLVEVANRLRAAVRLNDTVGRLGGDEFVVILDGLGAEENRAQQLALQLADKIRQRLAQIYQLGTISHQCTASIGVVLFCGLGRSADSLLHQADLAMYEAKAAGRNQVCCLQKPGGSGG